MKDDDWVGQSAKTFQLCDSMVYTHLASSAFEIAGFNETGKEGQPDLWVADNVFGVYFYHSFH